MTIPIQDETVGRGRSAARRNLSLSLAEASMLHGCNRFHSSSVIRARIETGRQHSEMPVSDQFVERFRERFLELPSVVRKPERLRRLSRRLQDTKVNGFPSLAEMLLEAIVAVENSASALMYRLDEVDYAAVDTLDGGRVELTWSSPSRSLSLRCVEIALVGLNEILASEQYASGGRSAAQFEKRFDALRKFALPRRLTTTVSVIRESAKARGIPVAYVGASYLRLGNGKFATHCRGSITGKTSHTASQLSVDKRLSARTLRAQRIPVPSQIRVTDGVAARAAAARLGYPAVIKPLRGHGGAGVTIVNGPGDIPAALRFAKTVGADIVVEEFVAGHTRRSHCDRWGPRDGLRRPRGRRPAAWAGAVGRPRHQGARVRQRDAP